MGLVHTPALNHFFPPRLTVATSECGENIFDEMQGTLQCRDRPLQKMVVSHNIQ